MNKLIYISHDPLTESLIKHFFIKEFSEDGIAVEYWCVRKLLGYARGVKYPNEILASYYREISSYGMLSELLAQQDRDCIIGVELWFNWDAINIFKLLQHFPYRFSIDWYCNIPVMPLKRKIKDDLANFHFVKLVKGLARMIERKTFYFYAKKLSITPPPLFFAPGKRATTIFPHRNVVPLNHHDYETYCETTTNPPVIINDRRKFAVFLDVMLPFHPDFDRLRSKTLLADEYFRKLNDFFDKIEQQLEMDVIIAAHPKSSYTTEFKNRMIFKGRSSELVKESSLVLAHHSAAINYAILSKSKLLLVYTNEFLKANANNFILQNIYYSIQLYGQLLNCTVLNIDNPGDQLNIKPVDAVAYEKFIADYIVGDPHQKNYDLIKNALATYAGESIPGRRIC